MDSRSSLLLRCGLHPSSFDLNTLAQASLTQMHIGLYGGHSSIPMRPTPFSPVGVLPQNEPVAVALCSAQEIQTSRLSFGVDGVCQTEGDRFPLPGADYPAPLSDLLFAVAELLTPCLVDCRFVALVLPFPLRYSPSGEVFFLRPPANLRLLDWEGLDLRAALSRELSAHGWQGGSLCVLPSVSAAQLGAQLAHGGDGKRRAVGLYWDETFTTGFSLPQSMILKLKSGDGSLRLLDCGSGTWQGVPLGSVDLSLDRDALYPGEDLLDKLLSTRSLGEQYRFAMMQATEAGLLSFMCGREFLSLHKLSLDTLLTFLDAPEAAGLLADFCRHEAADQAVALMLGEAVLTRATQVIASQLLALLQFTGTGRDADAPVLIGLGGAAFARAALFTRFRALLDSTLQKQHSLHYHLCHNAELLVQGAAALALRNP